MTARRLALGVVAATMDQQEARNSRSGGSGALGPAKPSTEPQRPQTLILEDFPHPADARALSPNGRAHWATKRDARKEVASRVKIEADIIRLRAVHGPVRLTFRYVFPNRRCRDLDNLTTGVTKAAIDALVRGQWIEADDSDHVVAVVPEVVVAKNQRRLEILIEPAADRDAEV